MPTTSIPLVQVSAELSGSGAWSGSDGGDCTGTASFASVGGYVVVHFSAAVPDPSPAVDSTTVFLTAATTMPTGGDLYTGFNSGVGIDNLNGEVSADFFDLVPGDPTFSIQKFGGTGGSVLITGTRCDVVWHLIVAPASGGILGAEHVAIEGLDFIDGDTTVTFDGIAATHVTVHDSSHLTCVSPAHALGVVDVVVTTSAGSATLVDGYTYLDYTSTPIVDAGQAQEAHGPLPSTVTTDATVTPGSNNGTITYGWTQVDGPVTATITDPTAENTDLVFDTYVPGLYTFQLTATSEGAVFAASATCTVVIRASVPPRVTSGGRVVSA